MFLIIVLMHRTRVFYFWKTVENAHMKTFLVSQMNATRHVFWKKKIIWSIIYFVLRFWKFSFRNAANCINLHHYNNEASKIRVVLFVLNFTVKNLKIEKIYKNDKHTSQYFLMAKILFNDKELHMRLRLFLTYGGEEVFFNALTTSLFS